MSCSTGGGGQSGGHNDCQGLSGPVVDIVTRMSDAVDVVIAGHSHQAFNCVINQTVVTSAGSNGRLLTHIDLSVDKRSGQDATKPVCDWVDPTTIRLVGVPIDPGRTYRVAVNSFLAEGGDVSRF